MKENNTEDFFQKLARLDQEIIVQKKFSPEALKELANLEADETQSHELKSGLVYALRENYIRLLENKKGGEKLGIIKETVEAASGAPAKQGDVLNGFMTWSARGLNNQQEKEEALGPAIKLLENFSLGADYAWILNILKKHEEKAAEQIFVRLSEQAGEMRPGGAERLVIALSDFLSAESLRDKLNNLIEKNREDGNEKVVNNLSYSRAFITPNHDKIAIENLQKFYEENIKFEEYGVNEKMNEKEVGLLKSLVGRDEKVLEMGCGTGRLLVEMAKAGYDISGFDFTSRHAELTKKKLEEAGARAEVFEGDWHNIEKISDGSMDKTYSLGRNILHDYSLPGQVQTFREAARVLKPGGQFIFDIPDREKGGYGQMVEEYKEEMKKRGVKNFRYGTIYDSPDGKNFATRYAYSHEDIEFLAAQTGFKLKEIKKMPLETGKDDKNLYYVLEKCDKI